MSDVKKIRKTPKLALCMIVRDNEDTIVRALESAKPFIDYWVICDTGSEDDTRKLIKRTLKSIPGELHIDKWQNFGANRTLLLERAYKKAQYLLLMDSDWELMVEGSDPFGLLTEEAYNVKHIGNTEYLNTHVVQGDVKWHYERPVHELLASDHDFSAVTLPRVALHDFAVGGIKGRWHEDLIVLQDEMEKDPLDSRSAYYYAQTLREIARAESNFDMLVEAKDAFIHRSQMEGWAEETYYSLFQAGQMALEHGDWYEGVMLMLNAWNYRPHRLEALTRAVGELRNAGQYHTAYRLTSLYGPSTARVPEESFMVEPWAYQWGLLFEHSICAYYVGDIEGCHAACEKLRDLKALPDAQRQANEANLALLASDA